MSNKTILLAVVFDIWLITSQAFGEGITLQNISEEVAGSHASLPTATIYVAKEIVTLDPDKPSATVIAVVGDRILATGTLEELKAAAGDQPYTLDNTFAGKDQRASREGSLRAVTLDAASSLGLEKEVGSIVPGKLANFTILAENPVTCKASKIKDISIWGTVQEGRKLSVQNQKTNQSSLWPKANGVTFKVMDMDALAYTEGEHAGHDVCTLNHRIGSLLAASYLAGSAR